MGPKKYIECMVMQYEGMFGTKPKATYTSPLMSNDHPELDTTKLLDDNGIHQYQSLIGVLQWTITLGRFNIATAVMTMSGFRVAPRQGHLDRLKRICGYLSKMRQGCICVRTDKPDYLDMSETEYDWARTVYGRVKEELPTNAPKPLGKPVVMTTYVDANLYHNMMTGRSGLSGTTFLQPDTNQMVLKETSYSGNRNIWIRICRCKTSDSTNHRIAHLSKVLRSCCQGFVMIIWRQWVRSHRWLCSPFAIEEATPCPVIPLYPGGGGVKSSGFSIHPRTPQPSRHPQQALGIPTSMGIGVATYAFLDR
jgi:hypothetical protein